MKKTLLVTALCFVGLVHHKAQAQLSIVVDSVCRGNLSTLQMTGLAPDSVQQCVWDLDNNGIYNDASGITLKYVFPQAGSHKVAVKVTTKGGSTLYNMYTINAMVHPLPNVNFQVDNLCEGQAAIFKDMSTVATGSIVERLWDIYDNDVVDGANTSNFSFICGPAQVYNTRLDVKTDKGCTAFAVKTTQVYPVPQVNFHLPTICEEQEAILSNTTNTQGSPISMYIWKFDDGTLYSGEHATHVFDHSGTTLIQLMAINEAGCGDTIQQSITVLAKPTISFTGDTIIYGNNQIMLGASVNNAAQYQWSTGQGNNTNQSISVNQAGTYTVTVTDGNGCKNTAERVITKQNQNNNTNMMSFVKSRVLTPNGDGINDHMEVVNVNTPIVMSIYNSNGDEVFSTTDYKNDWDTSSLEDGSYYYVIKTSATDITGNINILK